MPANAFIKSNIILFWADQNEIVLVTKKLAEVKLTLVVWECKHNRRCQSKKKGFDKIENKGDLIAKYFVLVSWSHSQKQCTVEGTLICQEYEYGTKMKIYSEIKPP